MDFNDFYWHDAVVKYIYIDGISFAPNGVISFEIKWPDGDLDESVVTFESVYWTNLRLNFGIVADETILTATQLGSDDPDLIKLCSEYDGAIDSTELNVYFIDLNSTGGKIKIIAKGFRVYDLR